MMLLELAGTIMSGVLSGGATGLLGVALQQWGEAKKRQADLDMLKQQHTQTLELKRLDNEQQMRLAATEAASAERLAEIQAQARADEAASSDYQASLKADTATYLDKDAQKRSRLARWLMAIVDFLRGIIRPGITAYAMGLQTLLLLWVHDLWVQHQLNMGADMQAKLVMEIVGTTTYLVTTTTVWWFGVRPAARK